MHVYRQFLRDEDNTANERPIQRHFLRSSSITEPGYPGIACVLSIRYSLTDMVTVISFQNTSADFSAYTPPYYFHPSIHLNFLNSVRIAIPSMSQFSQPHRLLISTSRNWHHQSSLCSFTPSSALSSIRTA